MIFYESNKNVLFAHTIKIINENLCGCHFLRLYGGHLLRVKVPRGATYSTKCHVQAMIYEKWIYEFNILLL